MPHFRQGSVPVATATQDGKQVTDINEKGGRINFYISPKKLYEETGFIWGDDDEI